MQILRTADERFDCLPEFPYLPRYCERCDQEGGALPVAWVEDGPAEADPVPMPDIWWSFRKAIQGAPEIQVGRFVESGCIRPMSEDVRAGYDAPFPDDTYCAAPRAMPGLVPTTPDDPASEANRAAWNTLCDSATPAQGIDHPTIANAGHFLQEDADQELAEAVVRFMAR